MQNNELKKEKKGSRTTFLQGEDTVLTMEQALVDGVVHVTLVGELRSDTEQEIRVELLRFADVGLNIVVNMQGVTYIAPSVQHAFVKAQQKIAENGNVSMVLRGMTDAIYHEFDKTAASEMLMIEE